MILFFSLLSLCFSITSNENKGNQNTFDINHDIGSDQNFQSKKSLATCYEGPFSGYTVGQACYIFTGDSVVTSTNFIFTGNDEHYIEFQGKATITGSSVSTDNQITSSLIRFSSDVEINDFTVKNVVASSNSFGLLNFDSPTVSITDLKFTGTTKVTLFQGSVSQEFELKDSTIKGLNGNDASDIFGLIHTNLLSTTKSDLVFTFTNINFIENKSPVFLTDSRLTINVLIDSCTFEKNQASTGCCAYMRTMTSTKSNYKITFKDNTFNENQNSARTSIIGGALYITTQETVFEGLNSFSGNEAQFEGDASSEEGAYGSSIYLTQNTLEKYTLIGLIFENDHSSHNGGSIFIYGKDDKSGSNKYPVVIQDCVFTNCYADNNGGAICSGMATTSGIGKGNNDVEIDNCTFTKCRAAFGGALYFEVGSEEGDEETKISNCVFDSNIGGYGSSIYCKSYGFILTESKITNSEKYGSRRDESFLYVYMAFSDRTPYIQDCNFTNNFQTITFISKDPVATSDSSIVSFTNCIFENNDLTLDSIGLLDLSIVSSRTLKITSCTFNKNKGACIKAANSICTAIVSKCIFNGNQGTQGCAIYIDISISSSDKLTIDNCLFTDNIVSVKDTGRASGIVHASTKSVKFTGVNTFIGNSAIYDGSALENPTNDNCAYGGSVFLEHSSIGIFVLSNLIIKDSYSTHYGGGIGLFNEDSKSDIPVYVSIENCTFENCSAGVHGGAFTSGVMNAGIGEKDNDVQFKFCNFYGCNAKEGAGIYVQDGTEDGDEETILYNCLFDACTGSIGTCIYCRSYKFEMHNTIIQNCNVSTHGVSESCIYVKLNEAGIKPFIENCTFTRNEQHVEFYSLLDDDSALDNSIEFKKCKFNLNNALTNGADSILDLQYIYSGEVYFDDCRFEENGGQALKQETDSVCNTYIRNCVFYNNRGGSGCAIYVATTKDDIFVTIENCLFSSNIATSTYGPRGSVFVSTKSIIFKGINTFNSNENIYDTMVPEEIPSGSEASHGGSLSILQEIDSEFILRDLVFMSSKSSHYGGALSVFCPDKERDENGLFFNIENCTFSGCTAGIYGGAISIGLLQHNGKHLFDNDIKISNCLFTKCNATNGGALFFPDGDEIGDEETIIYNCTFDACEGTNGSSIYVRSYKFEMHHSIIKNSIKVGTQHQSCIYGNLNEANVNPVINNCSFFNNEQNIEFHSKNISGSAANSVVFSNCFFHQNNQVTNGADSILELKYIQSDLVKFDSCIFDNNYGCSIRLESGSFCSTTLFNCTFCNNYGQNGCSLYLMSTSSAQTLFVIEDCTFKNNTVVSSWGPRGTIYMSTIDVDFKGINYFIDNKCIYETYDDPGDPGSGIGSYGGSIFIVQEDEKEHTISNLVFQNSYSTQYGGAIGMFAEDTESGPTELFFHFINITFDNCTSGLRGGALTCGAFNRVSSDSDNDIKMTNCTFLKCHSLSGGALYFQDGTEDGDEETYLYNCLFDGCTGTSGSSIYCRSYKFEMHDSIIQNSIPYSSSSSSKGTFLYCNLNEANVQPLLRNCTFYNNEQNFEFSCILDDGAINHNSISFEGCNFLQNNKDSNGADTVFDLSKILTETLTFTNCLFESNGGRCLSQDSSNYCNTLIQNCTFSKNHGGDGCGLYFRQNSIEGIHYTIHNSTFIDNICQSINNPRGVIFAHTASTKFTGINYFINNQVIYEEYEGQPTPGRNEGAYGGSLFLYQDSIEEYTLSNLVFINSYSTHYGGALGILCMDNSSTAIEIPNFINLENCTFINCSSKVQGGAFTTSTVNFGGRTQNDNDVKLSFCTFINCSSSEGGGVYFQDGTEEGDEETYIHHCTFDGCGGTTGTSIYCRSYKFEMYDTIIKNSVHTSSPTHQSCLYIKLNEGNIKPIIQNCTFLNNEQNIDFYSQLDDGTSSTNSISFIKCLFSKNNQVSNGADSILELQYIQSGEVHFEQCTFDQNGGQCLKQESGTICNTYIQNCTFSGNHGGSGSAIYIVSADNNIKATIQDCIFRDNTVKSSYGPRGGAVQVTDISCEFLGINQFINNQALYDSYEGESTPGRMQGSYGGSLFILQEQDDEYLIKNMIFINSYSEHYGGALGIYCIDNTSTIAHSIFVNIENCIFRNCSSGVEGGSITCGAVQNRFTMGDNDVLLRNCTFTECKSTEGGALYFIDGTEEGDEETYIYNCTFDGCGGTTGTSIYCRSYKFEMYDTIIKNSVHTSSPTHQSCLYIKLNEGNIKPIIQNCTFLNNEQNIDFYSQLDDGTSSTNSISFIKCLFSKNNQVSNGADSILELQYIQSGLVLFQECVFEGNGGQCLRQDSGTHCNTHVKNCTFYNNHGGSGCAIYVLAFESGSSSNPMMTIEDCIIRDNYVSSSWAPRGVVYITTVAATFVGTNHFINNRAYYETYDPESTPSGSQGSYGGSLFIVQESNTEYTLANQIFTNSYSDNYGGAIGIYCLDSDQGNYQLFINIENCTFDNCTAKLRGGALTCGLFSASGSSQGGDNDVKLTGCHFIKCNSTTGGALYFQDGTESGDEETYIYNCIFDQCGGTSGSAVYCRSYKFEMHDSLIQNSVHSHSPSHQSCIYVRMNEAGVKPIIQNCTFYNNEQNIEFYSILDSGSATTNTVSFIKCNFTQNNQMSNGADSIIELEYLLSGTTIFESCLFENNGGQCIRQESGTRCNSLIKDCIFTNNHGGGGCCIYALAFDTSSSIKPIMTIESCTIQNNIVSSTYSPRGVIYITDTAAIFKGVNHFIDNQAIYETYDPETIPSGMEGSYGGSLFIAQDGDTEYTVSNLVFTNSYSSNYGGAIGVFCLDTTGGANQLFITIDNCTFDNCTSGNLGGALTCGAANWWGQISNDNDIKLTNCNFMKCKSPSGGALYFQDGTEEGDEETIIDGCIFDSCEATSGSAIYCRSYKFEIHNSKIMNSEPKSSTPRHQTCIYVQMNEVGVEPLVINCTFYNNEQNIEFHSLLDDGTFESNSISFVSCNFTFNNQVSNGADSILDLQYIQSGNVIFDCCYFSQNGGNSIKQDTSTVCNTLIKKCTFTNCHSGSGCAIFCVSGKADAMMTIEDCTFFNNSVISYSSPRGVVYISDISAVFKGVNYFIDNQAIYETYDPETIPSGTEGSYGGSLFIAQEGDTEYTISNVVFTNSYSSNYGGALGVFCTDTSSGAHQLFVNIENCTFDNCSSGLLGGAFTCGSVNSRGQTQFDNDIKLSYCTFLKCHSLSGGALYFQDGTEEGDEETYLYNCLFDGCTGTNGSSIYCRSYKFEMHDSIIQNSIPYSSSSSSKGTFLYCNLNEANVQPLLRNCTFYNNEQNFEFSCILDDGAINHNSISFEGCNFLQNNKDSNGADTVFDLSKILTETLTFTNCLFESNGGRCLSQDSSNYCNTLIQNCTFSKNHGGDGCGLYFRQNSIEGIHYTIHNSTFIDNICQSSNNPRGVIFAHTASTKFTGINYFINNQVIYEEYEGQPTPGRNEGAYGGSLFLYQDSVEKYTLSNLVFINSYSTHYGGALGILCMDNSSTAIEIPNFINLENCTFINCSSKVQGGAFTTSTVNFGGRTQNDNDVKLSFCTFINCSSSEGGGVYFQDGTEEGDEETYIHHCTFDGCGGTTGTSIYCRSYKFEMYDTIIKNSVHTSSPTHQSCLYIKLNEGNIKPIIQNCTFLNNEQNIDFYSQLDDGTSSTNSISFIKCLFSKNNQVSNGADSILELQYIQSGEVHFEQCTFDQNGGQCLKQESGTTCATFVKDCIFTGNHGASGSAIYVVTSQGTNALMTIENNIFRDNIVASSYGPRGVVHITTVSAIIKGVNQFINNQAIYETYDPESIPSGMEGAYGGSLFIIQEDEEEYTLQNQVFQDCYSSNFAGAFGFFCIDTNVGAYQLFVHIINCTFTNCSSGTHGGALTCGVLDWRGQTSGDNDVSLTNCKFVNCKSPEGGALYFQDGTYEGDEETYIYNCLFDGCSGASGSAIYCRSYKFAMYNSTIQNSPHSSSPSHQSFLYVKLNEAMVKPVIDNCSFINNEQNIEFYSHLDVGTSTSNSISFLSCLFSKNNQQSNGADSILELQYIQSNTVLFDSCIFDQNGGQCLRQESGTFCNTNLKNCTFSNNHGGGGCAIYVIAFGSRKSSLLADTTAIMTIEECTFSDNTVSSSWGPRGAVYITTVAAVFKGVNYFINNKAIYDTYDTETVPGPSQGSNGGSLFIIQETEIEYTISNIVFTNSYSSNYGGAIGIYCLDDEASMAKLFIHIKNCTFNNCSSTFGGSISCLIEGSVDVVDSIFINGSAQNGGEIYCSDDTTNTPSSLTVRYSRFTLSNAISSGGAIYCNSGSVIIQANNFSQTGAKARGSCAYIEVEGEARIGYNNIHLEKESNITSIHFKSTNPSSKLVIAGGCYSSTRTDGDSSADFITYESTGSLEFIGKPCFQRSKEESINLIGSNIELSDEYFNCNECTDLIPPDPTPTAIVTVTSDSSESGVDGGDGSQSGGSKKLSGGAISGIVIACLVLVAAIIILIIFFLRRKTTDNEDARSEAISQEADDDTFSFTNQSGAPYTDNKPIWGGGTSDIGEASQVDDPFMKDFEEQEL